jgi:hypothetical protein
MIQKFIETFIKGWGKRQVMKWLAVIAPLIGQSAESIPDVAGWIVGALLLLVEVLFSYINRRRLEAKAHAAGVAEESLRNSRSRKPGPPGKF